MSAAASYTLKPVLRGDTWKGIPLIRRSKRSTTGVSSVANASTNVFTAAAHGWANGQRIYAGVTAAGITAEAIVFVISATTVGAIPDQSSDEGESISFDVSSYFDDDDAFSFSATGLPTGLSINSSTGVITGTIANESADTYAVTITGTAGGDSVDQDFDWLVTDPSPVAVGTIPDQSTEEGVGGISWDITGYFSDPDGDTLSYSSSTLPPGLSVSSGGTVSGTISGGASSGSPYAVTITASDGDHSVDQTFDWVVAP